MHFLNPTLIVKALIYLCMLSLIASQPYIVFVQDSSYSKLHTALVNKLLRKWYGAYAVVLHTILYRGGELHEGPVFGRILRQTDRRTDFV